jgi:hypothetical protein
MDGVVPNEPVIGSEKRAMFPQCNLKKRGYRVCSSGYAATDTN